MQTCQYTVTLPPDDLEIEPSELTFHFESEEKEVSCCKVYLTNTTTKYMAFEVRLTMPEKYGIKPEQGGIIPPGETFEVIVTTKQFEPDLEGKDLFLIKSMTIAPMDIFRENKGRYVEEKTLRTVLLMKNPSNPVQE